MEATDDPKQRKKYEAWLARQEAKPTSDELKQIKKLEREALGLWRQVVKNRAGGVCEAPKCDKTKRLNMHHIEGYATNKTLRYNPENGLCLCSTHHKFGRQSAHKSFGFMYLLMSERPVQLARLLAQYNVKQDMTIERLESIIQGLESQLKPKLIRRK